MIYVSFLKLYHRTDSCICKEERRRLAVAVCLSKIITHILIFPVIHLPFDNSFFFFFLMGYINMDWSELFSNCFLNWLIITTFTNLYFFHKPCCHGSFTECYFLCYQLLWKHILKFGLRAWFMISGFSVSENMIQASAIYNIQITVYFRICEKLMYSYENNVWLFVVV